MLKAYRMHGHLAAQLDPLGTAPGGDPALDPANVGLTPELMAMIPARILRMYVPGATLAEAIPHLRETYCGPIAYEIEHIASHRQRLWLREAIESGTYRHQLTAEEQKQLLERLTAVDSFERFMGRAYLGAKRFSVEGLDMTVPMIDEIVRLSGEHGAREVVVGMAHRGRVNVLAHNLGRPYESLFAEFEGANTLDAITTIPDGGTGDVKYHHGYSGTFQLPSGESLIVRLESNPSHLEFVAPVVSGATRAAQTNRQGAHANQDTDAAVPIVLHGDASFPGQGVVAETLNLQALDGYTVGGTIHIIQNNQVGFTTDPEDSRSTTYASDMAKGFDVPIIHVNADNVEACVTAVRLAFAFRKEFGHDVMIDLIGYRRHGHNEGDEPLYTQPEMYAQVKKHEPVRELFAKQMIAEGVITEADAQAMTDAASAVLAEHHNRIKERIAAAKDRVGEHATGEYKLDSGVAPEVNTAVDAEKLHILNEELLATPEDFEINRKLAGQLAERRKAFGEEHAGINWAHAESLAFAALLNEGIPLRLTGQDTERGTFSQRHLVLHDAKTGREHSPIQHLPGALATMELHNSPLSEMACIGFEYGYSQEAPETLVMWEAQFGDFANGAQVMIDQFIAPGLAKWGVTSRLTLLLPHGYEGAGPEHSSARLERFLQLAAEGNLRVANLTTPAQYFHLLRRQARIAQQRPLVIMTPKSLLRLPAAASHVEDLTSGRFQPVLAEPGVDPRAGPASHSLQRQDLLRHHRQPAAGGDARCGDRPRGDALPVPRGGDPRAGRQLPEPHRGPVGPGGAAQHGCARPHVTAPAADPSRAAAVWLRRPARARCVGRGLPGRALARAEPDRHDGDRPRASRLAVPAGHSGRPLNRRSFAAAPLNRGGADATRFRVGYSSRKASPLLSTATHSLVFGHATELNA